MKKPNRHLIFVHGDKGGVGKSTFARALADYYTRHALNWRGYDTDSTNGHLLRFYPEHAAAVDIHSADSMDQLLNSLDQSGTHWLIDLRAQSGDKLIAWMAATEFLEICRECNATVTIAFVISPVKDSVYLLKSVTDQLGNQAGYVIVKNQAPGSTFTFYDQSKTRRRLLEELGAVEIRLPELLESTYFKVDQRNLAWSDSVQSMDLQLAERQRVKVFLRTAFAELEKAAPLLIG